MAINSKVILIAVSFVLIIIFLIFCFAPSGFFYNKAEWSYGLRLVKDNVEFRVYQNRASWLKEGTLPYRDVKIEYPQIAVFYLAWPALLASNLDQFQKILAFGNLFCFWLLIFITLKILKFINKNLQFIWLLFLPSCLYFTLNRFDILPTLLVQLIIFLILKKRYLSSFWLLIISFFVKWYTVILLPIILLFIYSRAKNYKSIIKKGLTRYFIMGLGIFIFSFIFWGAGVLFPYQFQISRGWEIGSFFYLFWQYTTFLENPLASLLFLAIIFLMQFVPLFYLGINFYFHGLLSVVEKLRNHKQLITWFCLLVIFFISFAKFYSGQWMLWLTPLFILQINSKKELFLIIILDIINYLQFPVLYDSRWIYAWPFDLMVLGRSLLMVWLIFILIKKIKTPPLIYAKNHPDN